MRTEWKQVLKRGLLLPLAVLCLLEVVLSVNARAINLKPGPLVVTLSFGQMDWAEDMNAAGVVLDLYQVAKAENNTPADSGFQFILNTAFSAVDLSREPDEVAANAAAIAKDSADPIISGKKLGETIEAEPGLYLVVAHGNNPKDKSEYFQTGENGIYTIANAAVYEYQFMPQLVSIPTKAERTTSNTADKGDWIGVPGSPLTIYMKVGRELPLPCYWNPPVKKVVEGPGPEDSVFTFAMIPAQPNAPMPENKQAKRDETTGALYMDRKGPGKHEFGWMQFDEHDIGKTYTYTIRELPGADSHYTYDAEIYRMTVRVTAVNRRVALDVTYTDKSGKGNNVDIVTFTNVYKVDPSPAPSPVPSPVPSPAPSPVAPKTGDNTNIGFWVGLMLISIIGLCVLLLIEKRRKDRNHQ